VIQVETLDTVSAHGPAPDCHTRSRPTGRFGRRQRGERLPQSAAESLVARKPSHGTSFARAAVKLPRR
jgi:hypothetical protein